MQKWVWQEIDARCTQVRQMQQIVCRVRAELSEKVLEVMWQGLKCGSTFADRIEDLSLA